MDERLKAFLRVLDSTDTSTGGGTASAIAGAMAAALVAMVARLSIGKEGMEDEVFYSRIVQEAESLAKALFAGGCQDSQAFGRIREAHRLPKESKAEKATRREAIQQAWLQATRIPLENAERGWQTLELAHALTGCSNPNTASDLECAQHLARAGILGCLSNVKSNLPFIQDPTIAAEFAKHMRQLHEQLEKILPVSKGEMN